MSQDFGLEFGQFGKFAGKSAFVLIVCSVQSLGDLATSYNLACL